MRQVGRQMLAQAGRIGATDGEARGVPISDEIGGPQHESGGTGSALLCAMLTRENLQQAWKRVKANKGAAGVDGLDIDQTARQLMNTWPEIREQLIQGTYRPRPVRKVAIPKPEGGMRELGIPTVVDRLIQQALLQVLQPILDPQFSRSSYGFRPGRNAHDAVCMARQYVQEGYRIVVDVDLEKFFDSVNHDILIDRLRKRVDDAGVVKLIRLYLNSGIMSDGIVKRRGSGTPQGGPLSPLLANVLLDEVDKELENRGHRFCRYADDCNVYVRSVRAGERVMAILRKAYARLHLTVNESKSRVASVFGRKFLGYGFWVAAKGVVRCRVASKPLKVFKQRVRYLTRRLGGCSMQKVIERLRTYLLGWKAYYKLAQTPNIWRGLDRWVRHRLRAFQLKQWKNGPTVYRELRKLGASKQVANRTAGHAKSWWRSSAQMVNVALTNAYFDRLGVPRLS